MKFMKPLMIAFAVIILPFMVLSTMQLFGWSWPLEFSGANIVMAVLLSIFVVLLIISAFGQRFRIKKLGTYLLHFGFIMFLVGSFLYLTTGLSLTVAVPVDNTKAYSFLEDSQGEVVELGFSFGLDEFKITYYDPVYDVYEMGGDEPKTIMTDIQIEKSNSGEWYYDFEDYGTINLDDLLSGEKIDTIQESVILADGIVAFVRLPVKEYEASITFIDDKGGENTKELLVNHPLYKNGFKIYLMGYDEMTSRVTLMFKKDVGEPLSTAGLVVVMVGTFFQCIIYPFIERREKGKLLSASKDDKEEQK